MTDYKRLRDTCQAVVDAHKDGHSLFNGERARALTEFRRTVHAETVLSLLADNDRLRAEVERLLELPHRVGAVIDSQSGSGDPNCDHRNFVQINPHGTWCTWCRRQLTLYPASQASLTAEDKAEWVAIGAASAVPFLRDENDALRAQLAATIQAKDEACDIALGACGFGEREELMKPVTNAQRISELRALGSTKKGGE